MKLATVVNESAPPAPVVRSPIAQALFDLSEHERYERACERAANDAQAAKDRALGDIAADDDIDKQIAAHDVKLTAALAARYAGNGSDETIAVLKQEKAQLEGAARPRRDRRSEGRQVLEDLQRTLDEAAKTYHAALWARPALEYKKWEAIAREKLIPETIAAAFRYFETHCELAAVLEEADHFVDPAQERPRLSAFGSPLPFSCGLINGEGGIWGISKTPQMMDAARQRLAARVDAILKQQSGE